MSDRMGNPIDLSIPLSQSGMQVVRDLDPGQEYQIQATISFGDQQTSLTASSKTKDNGSICTRWPF
jgi:hypothetical protein